MTDPHTIEEFFFCVACGGSAGIVEPCKECEGRGYRLKPLFDVIDTKADPHTDSGQIQASWERCPVCTTQCTENECKNGCNIETISRPTIAAIPDGLVEQIIRTAVEQANVAPPHDCDAIINAAISTLQAADRTAQAADGLAGADAIALEGYRAAVSFIGADSWDGCSDCIEILRAARATDMFWNWSPDETARALGNLRARYYGNTPSAAFDRADRTAQGREMVLEEALRPFAEIGAWLFARDLPDDTPMVEFSRLNNSSNGTLTRGHFKAAHSAILALDKDQSNDHT